MTRVTATQADPAKPGAEDWRPASSTNLVDKERSDFLSSWGADGPMSGGKDKPAAPAEPDDDEDLEDADPDLEDDDDEVEVEKPAKKQAKAKAAEPEKPEEPDDDSDLEDDDEDEPEKPDADPAVARGFAKLQKQEQRMRQQLDRERSQWQSDLAKERDALQAEKSAAAEARAKFDRLAARAKADPAGALEELGVDDWDYTAKQTFTRSKAGSDPANKEAAARLQSERELKSKLSDVEKKLAEREKSEAEQRKEAEMRSSVETYLGGVVKSAASVKNAGLTQKMLAADPDYGLARIKEAAGRLYKGGEYPEARKVIIEVEKAERAMLRRYGINPKTLAPSAANGNAKAGKAGKVPNGKAVRKPDDDELRLPSKEELLNEDWSG